jgi:acetylglutamate kinase
VNSEIAEILIEALPYIREFHGSLFVIKVGGHAMVEKEVRESILQDVTLLRFVGIKPVVVHGGGPEITEMMERLGKEATFVGGLRVTDDETLKIAQMVLEGSVNTDMVSILGRFGAMGVGLSGKDGGLIKARKKKPQHVKVDGKEIDVDLGWVGEVESIEPDVLLTVLDKGYIPVISPIAVDTDGNSLNVNADTVAGEIATTLKARKLILLTDVTGVMADEKDPSSLYGQLTSTQAKASIKKGHITEGMLPKVRGCLEALERGVQQAHIIDGNMPHSLLLEVFTDQGVGTMFKK